MRYCILVHNCLYASSPRQFKVSGPPTVPTERLRTESQIEFCINKCSYKMLFYKIHDK